MKSIYENLGGTYKASGDYSLPTFVLPKEEPFEIGVWGQRYLRHLKENHRIIYYNYLTKGILNKHITEVDIRAEKIFQQLVKSLAEKENVTESLKAKDMMLWVQKINNIRNRASEIVNTEVIFVLESIIFISHRKNEN